MKMFDPKFVKLAGVPSMSRAETALTEEMLPG